MREKLFDIIEPANDKANKGSSIYDIVMLISILLSMVPLLTKKDTTTLFIIDRVTAFIFIFDYLARLLTADIKLNKGAKSFFLYPFTPMAIIDLLSILPSLIPINSSFKVLRLIRIVRTLKVFKSFKMFRYSKNLERLLKVFKNQSHSLAAVASMALFYVFFTALIMFNIEPSTFDNFFEALYWSAISLTSVGYGDIIPVSDTGRLFTIVSALMGVAVVALPSGIITAGYIDILNEERKEDVKVKETKKGND